MKKVYDCPVDDYTCPYWQKDGTCGLHNPTEECDEFMWYEEEEEEE